MKKLFIGLDWDCTLYFYDYDKKQPINKQDIIPLMKEKVLSWLKDGHKVFIFSAKASNPTNVSQMRSKLDSDGLSGIKQITNIKHSYDYIVDDKVLKICENKGTFESYDPISSGPEAEIGKISR